MIFPALEVIPVSAKWYVYSKNPDVAEHLKISPVIRLTEMNYILAECHARNGNYGEAYGILNNIRAGRQLDRLAVGKQLGRVFDRFDWGCQKGSGFLKDSCFSCTNVWMQLSI